MTQRKSPPLRPRKPAAPVSRRIKIKAAGLTISVIAAGLAVGLMQRTRRRWKSPGAPAGQVDAAPTTGQLDLATSTLELLAGDGSELDLS